MAKKIDNDSIQERYRQELEISQEPKNDEDNKDANHNQLTI